MNPHEEETVFLTVYIFWRQHLSAKAHTFFEVFFAEGLNFFGKESVYMMKRKERGMQTMAQDIYDRTVSYILENQEKFYRLAYSYVRDKDSALDVVQNAICKGLEKCYDLKNPDALKTWFYRIVVNESIQYIRKNRRETVSADGALPEQIYREEAFDKDHEVYEEVLKLPEQMKTIVILHFYEGLTLKQISEVTGVNLSTVKSRLYSALDRMEKNLKEAAV